MNSVQILYHVLFISVLCCTAPSFAMQWIGSFFWDYDEQTAQKSEKLEESDSSSGDEWVLITKSKTEKELFVEQLCQSYQSSNSEYTTKSHKAVFNYNAALVTVYKHYNDLHAEKIEQAAIVLGSAQQTEEYITVQDIMGLTAAEWKEKLAKTRAKICNYSFAKYTVTGS